jgi:hypothetical protein
LLARRRITLRRGGAIAGLGLAIWRLRTVLARRRLLPVLARRRLLPVWDVWRR